MQLHDVRSSISQRIIKAEMENAEHRFILDLVLYSLIKRDRALPRPLGPRSQDVQRAGVGHC